MKLEKLAAIAEIVGSAAVVITLAYLAVQTRQTNVALLANSRQATMSADIALIASAIGAPQAWTNLHKPFAELSLQEQEQATNMIAGLLRVREYAWFQYENGVLDEAALRSYLAPMTRWLRWDGAMTVWRELGRKELDPEFVGYVDRMLQESEPKQQ